MGADWAPVNTAIATSENPRAPQERGFCRSGVLDVIVSDDPEKFDVLVVEPAGRSISIEPSVPAQACGSGAAIAVGRDDELRASSNGVAARRALRRRNRGNSIPRSFSHAKQNVPIVRTPHPGVSQA